MGYIVPVKIIKIMIPKRKDGQSDDSDCVVVFLLFVGVFYVKALIEETNKKAKEFSADELFIKVKLIKSAVE